MSATQMTVAASRIPANAVDPERLAEFLESTGDYRILRRMRPLSFPAPSGCPTKRAIFVDVETTGLDRVKDSIIELAMLPFDYTIDGAIVGIEEPFSSLRDPGFPLPAEITELTGITDEMVHGASIDPGEVTAFANQAVLLVSHNADFDRPFCEREWPVFAAKPWACSLDEVDWSAEGFAGKKLSQIAAGYGFFFDAHRAVNDCRAGVDILAQRLPRSGRTGMAALLESARAPRWRVWAEGAPYTSRGILKARRYRWSSGDDSGRRAWYLDVGEDTLEGELEYLRREIYGREDVEIARRQFTAFDRYSKGL